MRLLSLSSQKSNKLYPPTFFFFNVVTATNGVYFACVPGAFSHCSEVSVGVDASGLAELLNQNM